MAETIKVYNDNGEEAEFYVLEQTRLGGADYLLTVEDIDAEEMEAWIFKQTGTDGEEVCYQTIDDENDLKLYQVYLRNYLMTAILNFE